MTFAERLSTVADLVAGGDPTSVADGTMLLVYDPEDESAYRSAEDALLVGLASRKVPHSVLDLRTLPFVVLDREKLIDDAPQLDAIRPGAFRRNLAGRLEKEVVRTIEEASRELGSGLLVIRSTTSVFPWVSFANVLRRLSTDVNNWLLIPFPGTATSSTLHFMGRRDGFDYMARRV